MMFALRQMMTALPNDVAYANYFGKHRIIANEMSNIIFAKQMHHIAEGDTSFHLAPPPFLCYNTLKLQAMLQRMQRKTARENTR